MLSSDKSNIFVSMKVQLASVYEEILSSSKVNLSSGEVGLSGMKVNLSSGEVGSSGMKVNLSSMKVNSSGSKVNLSKILILKSIVCCVCVMFSSDVSWGSSDGEKIDGNDIVLKEISKDETKDKEILGYKVVLLGDNNVGKTQIVYTKAGYEFKEDYQMSTSAEYALFFYSYKTTKKYYSKTIRLHTWDTSRSEKYKSGIEPDLTNVDAFVFVYDITNKKSFENIQTWIKLAEDNVDQEAVYFLVGNKADMENERQVSQEDAITFAKQNNMTTFCEVSAKTGTKINELFETIAKACFDNDTIEKINNGYIENTKNKYPTNNKNPTLNDSKESENDDIQIPTDSKNNRCNCCPCCNKDEDDQKEETKSPETTSNILTDNID